MTDRASAQGVGTTQTKSVAERLIWTGVYAGLILALVGVVDGFGVVGRHPDLGTAIVVVSLMLGILIVRNGDIDGGNAPDYPIADLKLALSALTMAPLDDESTWFDLETAVGGSEASPSS